MAKIKTLRRLREADRKTLGRDSRLQQAGEQSVAGICGRAQQQDTSNPAQGVRLEGRGISAFEGLNLYAGGDLN